MEKLLETDFLDNPVLIDGLCNHMRPALNRIKMNLFTENGHLEILKEKYKEIYEATITACEFLKNELEVDQISEGELGFIALYFSVAMEKKYAEEEKVSVCIACPHGVGTSHMLSVHLQKEFPEIMVRQIISTAELETSFPNVFVNSVLPEPDKLLIRKALKGVKKSKPLKKQKQAKSRHKIRRADIDYMLLLGQEILQVLDNIKISSEESVKSKENLIMCAGNLFARSEELADMIKRDLKKREDRQSVEQLLC